MCCTHYIIEKVFLYLAEAVKQYKDEVELTCIGIPDSKEDSRIIDVLEQMRNVKYIPGVSHKSINEYYRDHDIFVLPSLFEGSSLSVYEAMATGMPCIVTPNCGSVLRNGMDGVLVNPCSFEEIAEAIGFL